MDKLKSVARKTRNHIGRHKAAYAAGTVAITAVVLLKADQASFAKFLVEKGIDPNEFFHPEIVEVIEV